MRRTAALGLSLAMLAIAAPAATASHSPLAPCGTDATLLSEVQGAGPATPLDGQTVEVEAVVTGVFPGIRGVFLQEEEDDHDADPATSEGVFVYTRQASDFEVGDLVRLRGEASEYFDKTQLSYRAHAVCAEGVEVEPAELELPMPVADREALEGMLVELGETLHATNLYPTARYGEIELSLDGILRTATDVVAPGDDAVAYEEANAARTIQVDDGLGWQNPVPNPWFRDETSADPTAPVTDDDPVIRAGDSVDDLTGVLDYAFGVYEVLATEPVRFSSENPRSWTPESTDGNLTVAAFNVLNYFTTLDEDGNRCGPQLDQGCRGADDAQEFADQRAKIVSAITAMDAAVVGLVELENAPDDAPLADLVAGLNEVAGDGTYAFVPTGPVGTDAIRVGLIFQPAKASLVGGHAVLDSSVDPRFDDDKNRAVLAQSFRLGGHEVLTVAVNHLKSKGSSCWSLGDPDTGDGQGNCNRTRTAAAEAEAEWLAGDPTGVGDPDVLVVGDLNAYANEDPVAAFTEAGFVDVIEEHVDEEDDYTYVFNGRFGRLDHALASPALAEKVEGATIWHINSPEVHALGYDTRFEPFIAPGPFASSDHDPVIVGFEVESDD